MGIAAGIQREQGTSITRPSEGLVYHIKSPTPKSGCILYSICRGIPVADVRNIIRVQRQRGIQANNICPPIIGDFNCPALSLSQDPTLLSPKDQQQGRQDN
ncbi:MAG: hypothetical protein ACFFBD_08955 [Candidatus Hodarchaeota archaeon]